MKQELSNFVHKTGLTVKKHSPELCIVAGVVGFVGTIVLASRAAIKAKEVMKEHDEDMEDIRQVANTVMANPDEGEEYTEEDYKHDKLVRWSKTAVEMTKIYAPVTACGALTLLCFLSAYNITKKRYTALVGAYNALQSTFKAYRKRVLNEMGEDADRHFMYGTEKLKITEMNEKGKEKTEEVENVNTDNITPNMFARVFDESNVNWDKNPIFNRTFLLAQQDLMNHLLQARGHVFLNEVYDALGFERTPEGQVIGWCKNADETDNYIDFGLYNTDNEGTRRFVNGDANVVLLDFNVDGVIYDMIDKSFRKRKSVA